MTRMVSEERKRMIIRAAISVARDPKGLIDVNHTSVAKRCVIMTTARVVKHYFTLSELRKVAINDDTILTAQAREMGLIE